MSGFRFYIFNPRLVQSEHIEVFNLVYRHWKRVFTQVVESAGGRLDPDDFFRQEYIFAVLFQSEVVCISGMTTFDMRLESTLDHHYIQALNKATPSKLVKTGSPRLTTIEYLNVADAFRKSKTEVLWSEVLIGLGLLLVDSSPADALLGTPRIDVKVKDVCLHLDGIEVQEPISKMNYPCAVVVFAKQRARTFKNPVTQEYVYSLWRQRVDASLPSSLEYPVEKVA